jgi:predicted dehydrogenase
MIMVRVAIIGAGGIASQHIMCLMSIPHARIVAVVDVDINRARLVAEQCGAQPFARLSDCLSLADAVYVLTPPKFHAELCLEAIRAGKHVFVEKPVADTPEEAELIVRAAEQSNVLAMTAFNMRFRKGFIRLKQALDSGSLGEPISYWSQRLGVGVGKEPNWRTTKGQICGMTVESLSHDIDLIRWMCGEITGVRAQLAYTQAAIPEFDDNASTVFKLASGASAVLHASWSSHLGLNSRGIVGTKGTALIEGEGLWSLNRFRIKTEDMDHEHVEVLNDRTNESSYLEENIAFIDSIVHGKALPVTLHDGLQTVRISSAMQRSHQEDREISL